MFTGGKKLKSIIRGIPDSEKYRMTKSVLESGNVWNDPEKNAPMKFPEFVHLLFGVLPSLKDLTVRKSGFVILSEREG